MHNKYLRLNDLKNDNPDYRSTIFSLSNGHFGVRSSDPLHPTASAGLIVNGFYETSPIVYGENAYGYAKNHQTIVRLPDLRYLEISFQGSKFTDSKLLSSDLDMMTGQLKESYYAKNSDGLELKLDVLTTVDQTDSHRYFISYRIEPLNFSGALDLSKPLLIMKKAAISEDPRKNQRQSNLQFSVIKDTANLLIQRISTLNSQLSIVLGQKQLFELNGNQCFVLQGEMTEFNYMFYIGPIEKNTENQVPHDFFNIDLVKFKRNNIAYWADFWNRSRIEIKGNDELTSGLNYNIFQLNQSAGRDGKTNISAKGLSGTGYEGHYFWDTEMYMLPFFILTQPNTAKQLLKFRSSVLPQARLRARELGVEEGALFAWRTINGEEASAYYPAGTAQYHINGAISYGIGLYYYATKDVGFLSDYGLEILVETARFWRSFGTWMECDGRMSFVFNDVTGPDEYTAIVDNNYYTNRIAKHNLELAVELAEVIKKRAPEILVDLNLTDEDLKEFKQIATNIYLPYDDIHQVAAQDDSFLKKAIWPFSSTPKDKYPLLLHYHPLTIYRYQVCKQADMLLADMLFPEDSPFEQKERNYDYYENVTTHDSSLSKSIFSILAARLGKKRKAYRYFMDTALMDLDDLQGNTEDGLHLANLGGSWLSVIYGFAGVQITSEGLIVENHLPDEWEELKFSLNFSGRILQIKLTHDGDEIHLLEGDPIVVALNGEKINIIKTTR